MGAQLNAEVRLVDVSAETKVDHGKEKTKPTAKTNTASPDQHRLCPLRYYRSYAQLEYGPVSTLNRMHSAVHTCWAVLGQGISNGERATLMLCLQWSQDIVII